MTSFWHGRNVFMTGHTGFKGAWMSLLLGHLGARVTGYSLRPEGEHTLFDICGVADRVTSHHIADIRDGSKLQAEVDAARPDVIFHLAAQSLVRRSYAQPIETFETNVMGTAQVLEAARRIDHPCAVVIVTTDKVYENPEDIYPFRETDRLGANDPYSASKAAAELVTTTWRKAFAPSNRRGMRVASVRAGNVVGGGDWAEDRLIPDCVRAFVAGRPAQIRNPAAVRPWQHALDPLCGYMRVAERLLDDTTAAISEPMWNFGPDLGGETRTLDVATRAAQIWGDDAQLEVAPQVDAPKEAGLLRLDSTKAKVELGWRPVWHLERTIARTVDWYKAWAREEDMGAVCDDQIAEFLSDASAQVAA